MKTRAFVVCLVLGITCSLFAQTTLTMTDQSGSTVTGSAQDVSDNQLVVTSQINNNQTWDTKEPANGNTLIKIAFMSGTTALGGTPWMVTNVKNAKLYYPNPPVTNPPELTVYLTPATISFGTKHDVDEANHFLGSKLPTNEFCLTAKAMTFQGKRRVVLANGAVLIAAGKVDLLPKDGEHGCVCGRGLARTAGSEFEIFEITSRCATAPAKKK